MNVKLDSIFHSLADSTRRDIMKRLVRNELSVSEIAKAYNMSLAAVSKHLKVLEKAKLLVRRRQGKYHILQVNVKPLKEVDQWIEFYRKYWEEAFEKMDDYIANLQQGDKNNDTRIT